MGNTGLMPTKSTLAGICCGRCLVSDVAAAKNAEFLAKFAELRITTIAIPRVLEHHLPAARRMKLAFGDFRITTPFRTRRKPMAG